MIAFFMLHGMANTPLRSVIAPATNDESFGFSKAIFTKSMGLLLLSTTTPWYVVAILSLLMYRQLDSIVYIFPVHLCMFDLPITGNVHEMQSKYKSVGFLISNYGIYFSIILKTAEANSLMFKNCCLYSFANI